MLLFVNKQIMIEPKIIHTRVVPRLQATLWTVALFLGISSFHLSDPILVKLTQAFIIFLVFIWESAIMFLDIKNANPGKNFDGEVLGVNAKLFFIIPIPFILGSICYITKWIIMFYAILPIMGWLKLECCAFANNIESHFVDIKPTFFPNPTNE